MSNIERRKPIRQLPGEKKDWSVSDSEWIKSTNKTRDQKAAKASKITATEKKLLDTASAQKTPRKRGVKNEGYDLTPLAEKTDLDHTKKGKMKPYWKVPENVALEPEVFQEKETTPFSNQEAVTPQDEQEHLEMVRQHNIETFGTDDQAKIDHALMKQYEDGRADLEVTTIQEEFPRDPFEDLEDKYKIIGHEENKQPWKKNPKITTRDKFERDAHPGARFGRDNLKTISDTKSGRPRKWLNALSNFFSKAVEGIIPEDYLDRPTEEELIKDNDEKRAKEEAHYKKLEQEARADINAGWKRKKFPFEELRDARDSNDETHYDKAA